MEGTSPNFANIIAIKNITAIFEIIQPLCLSYLFELQFFYKLYENYANNKRG